MLKHQDKLNLVANTLLEIETLDQEQINHLFNHGTLPEPKVKNTKNNRSSSLDQEQVVEGNLGIEERREEVLEDPPIMDTHGSGTAPEKMGPTKPSDNPDKPKE